MPLRGTHQLNSSVPNAKTLLDLLRAQSTHWGLSAPTFAWWAAGFLLVGPLLVLAYLWWRVREESRTLSGAALLVDQLAAHETVPPSHGLPAATYDSLAQLFTSPISLRAAWNRFNSLIIPRRQPSGEQEYWASESSEAAFTEAALIEGRLNRAFYSSIPGIVTGTGLLFTFLAILVALLDVRMGQNQQIQGLNLLIEGLSGKFVSSIGALASATIYLVAEKPLLHSFAKARLRLIEAVDALVPRLSPVRLLAELQWDGAEQSAAFRSFNSDLSLKLKQSFSESIGPTLNRMVEAIDNLNQLLRAAEAQKQESITGALGTAIGHLEEAIRTSLEGMGEKFKESLSGSAKDEFGRVTETLTGAARVLENVRVQSEMTQTALSELISQAKSSAADQMALGRSQVEDLTAVMRQFMIQMNETAGASVTQMASTLTGVVHDLSVRVTDLGAQMATAMRENSEKTSHAASAVVEQAETWSARSTAQLSELLEEHKKHLTNVRDVDSALESALGLFNDSLERYAALNADLRKIGADINANAVAVAGATHSMQETQKSVQQVAAYAATQIERLGEANRAQTEVWASIHGSMEQYKKLFNETEKTTRELLMQIMKHLDSHLDLTKRGYEQLVATADNHFKAATQRLGSSVAELDEYLQDLTESLAQGRGKNDGRRS